MWPAKEIEKLEDRVKKLERQRNLDLIVSNGGIKIGRAVVSIELYCVSTSKERIYQLWVRDDETHHAMILSKEDLRQLKDYLGKKLKEMESEEKLK